MAFDGTLQEFTVNMHGKTLEHSYIEVQQADTASRKVRIHLKTFGGEDYVIPYGATAVLCVNKSDKTEVLEECEIEDQSTVLVTFTSQALACPGKQLAQLYFATENGDIKTQNFYIHIPRAAYKEDSIKSSNEYGVLQSLIAQVTSHKDGTTFIPHISEDGELYWTNDGGMENPEPVNIIGPPGEDGEPGADGQDGYTPEIGENENWFINGEDTGMPSRGKQGEKGDDGEKGEKGDTGEDGKSAYEYAKDGGYTGTEEEFATKLAEEGMTVVDTSGLVGEAGKTVMTQELLDVISDAVLNKLVTKAMMSGVQIDSADMVPTSALVYAMQEAITKLNSEKAPRSNPTLAFELGSDGARVEFRQSGTNSNDLSLVYIKDSASIFYNLINENGTLYLAKSADVALINPLKCTYIQENFDDEIATTAPQYPYVFGNSAVLQKSVGYWIFVQTLQMKNYLCQLAIGDLGLAVREYKNGAWGDWIVK